MSENSGKKIEIAGKKLVIHEHQDVCDPVTGRALTGSWLWDSAVFLANWMANEGRLEMEMEGKTVVELGAGTGLPGLVAATLGAGRVVLTDLAALLPGLQRNVDVNGLEGCVEVRELVWGSEESAREGVGKVDLVFMSDLFYDACEMRALANTLKGVCRAVTRVWAACEIRSGTNACLDVLMEEGFSLVALPGCCGASSESANKSPTFAVFLLNHPHGRV